jgi:hypothetical protein
MDAETTKLMNSKCKKDSEGQHRWEDKGVVGLKPSCLVWRCYQCKKIVYEELKPLRLRGKNHEKGSY